MKIHIDTHAERDLQRFPRDVFERLIAAIRQLDNDPRPPGCRKLVGSKNDWRIRVGPYRILYTIDDTARIVCITAVVHRKDAY